MKNMTAVALVALVTVVCMTAAGEVQAKDKWGINISPYGTSFYYKTGGGSYSFSTGPAYYHRPYHRSHSYRPVYRTYVRPVYVASRPVYITPRPVYVAPVYTTPRPVIVRKTIVNNHYYSRPAERPSYSNGFGGHHHYTYGFGN